MHLKYHLCILTSFLTLGLVFALLRVCVKPVTLKFKNYVDSFPMILTSDKTSYQRPCETSYSVRRLKKANSVKIHLEAPTVIAISVRCFHRQFFCNETGHQVLKANMDMERWLHAKLAHYSTKW